MDSLGPAARVFRRLGPLGFVLVVIGACQGASATDLFDSAKSPDYDGGRIEPDATASSSSSGGAVDSGPETDSGSSGDDAGASSSSGGQPDAEVDLDPMNVYCTNAIGYCGAATPACCGRKNGDGSVNPFQCKAACDAATETVITCDDDQDCQGQICCIVHNESNGQPLTVQCQDTCQPANNVTRMCDPRKPDPCAPFNETTCRPHPGLPGLYACIN